MSRRDRTVGTAGWPYGPTSSAVTTVHGAPTDLTLIPYFRWANRGSSTMRVWVPRADVPTA